MKFRIFILISLFPVCLFSQSENDSIVYDKTVCHFSVIAPGFAVEQNIKNNKTILVEVGTGFEIFLVSENINPGPMIQFVPYMSIEPRVYTDLLTRKQKGRIIDYYSGAYGGFNMMGNVNLFTEQWKIQSGPVIGFQITGKDGLYFNIAVGVGAIYNDINIKFGNIGYFKIGTSM